MRLLNGHHVAASEEVAEAPSLGQVAPGGEGDEPSDVPRRHVPGGGGSLGAQSGHEALKSAAQRERPPRQPGGGFAAVKESPEDHGGANPLPTPKLPQG
eukprot:15434768-Alexandrium_andersonii.AAC.1